MYKMVVIDDEKVEREGMIRFVDWAKYDIEIVGDAWNGQEGLSLIQNTIPDIILTDVKMPEMDGIEMIEYAMPYCPESVFVVLSGYGDYEFTSRAMSLGVKHYILKPCDEESMAGVLERAKKELEENRRKKNAIERLLPGAKAQFFKNALRGKSLPEEDVHFYENACLSERENVILIVFQGEAMEYQLSSFVVENIFEELMGEDKILMKAEIDDYVIFLLRAEEERKFSRVVSKLQQQFKHIFNIELRYALSESGQLREIHDLYRGAAARLQISAEKIEDVLNHLDYDKMKAVQNMDDVLLEYHVVLTLFRLRQLTLMEMMRAFQMVLAKIYGKDERYQIFLQAVNETDLYEMVIRLVMEKSGIQYEIAEQKLNRILLDIYEYSSERQMSMQWLAREILYMNEDYLSRMFKNVKGQKLPDYLFCIRMETVARILQSYPDCTVAELATLIGYSEDGQYLGKVFKKYFGRNISEYRA